MEVFETDSISWFNHLRYTTTENMTTMGKVDVMMYIYGKCVTTSNLFVLISLDKSHLNPVCTHYAFDKSENARMCAKWQWNTLDWCCWIALSASPVVQSNHTISCVSLSFLTHPCVILSHNTTEPIAPHDMFHEIMWWNLYMYIKHKHLNNTKSTRGVDT